MNKKIYIYTVEGHVYTSKNTNLPNSFDFLSYSWQLKNLYMYIYIYVCMYVFISFKYTHTHIHTNTHTHIYIYIYIYIHINIYSYRRTKKRDDIDFVGFLEAFW